MMETKLSSSLRLKSEVHRAVLSVFGSLRETINARRRNERVDCVVCIGLFGASFLCSAASAGSFSAFHGSIITPTVCRSVRPDNRPAGPTNAITTWTGTWLTEQRVDSASSSWQPEEFPDFGVSTFRGGALPSARIVQKQLGGRVP